MKDRKRGCSGSADNTFVSAHGFPRPLLRRAVGLLLAVGLALCALAVPMQLILAFTGAPLLVGTALFTAILAIPLLMRTVLHPAVEICVNGLVLRPMLWPAQFVHWHNLRGTTAHPLVFNDPAVGQHLYGQRYRPREGLVVLVAPPAQLWPVYRLIGQLAGVGSVSAFAISSTTHTDYELLAAEIQRHLAT